MVTLAGPTTHRHGRSTLRILALNWRDRFDPWGGGAELQLHEILRRLVQRGHEVTWLACRYAGAVDEELREDGIRYLRAGHWKLANFVLPRLLRRELARTDYDVVLEDINKIPFYAPLYTRLPVVVMVPHLFGTTIFRETNPIFASYVLGFEWPLRWIYRGCLFSAASPSTAADLTRRGIDPRRIEVIYNGMDHGRYELENPPPRNSHPTLLHIGRLRRYKSVDVAVRAMAIVHAARPDARLVVIGEGPEEARLKALARRLGLSDVIEFRGYRRRDEIVEQLYRSHVLLQTSPKEGWGLTVIEANECRVPAVASRAPGLVDSVRDGETGLLARYGDAADFASKALHLLSDEALRQRMGEAALHWARGFSWDAAASASEGLLLRAVAERAQ